MEEKKNWDIYIYHSSDKGFVRTSQVTGFPSRAKAAKALGQAYRGAVRRDTEAKVYHLYALSADRR